MTSRALHTQGAGFEQAKTNGTQPQFLQIVAKPDRPVTRKPEPKLTRVNFAVSRLMEFCTQRELENQTGHSCEEWPLVVCKELIDNSLDAAEEFEVAPEIEVIVEPDKITVQDNAGGIDQSTITSVLDYSVRVSSREAYVSPTRGAQGNALKTLAAMDYVLQGASGDAVGVTIIETRGKAHRIEFRVDHINNQPRIFHAISPSPVTVGTRFAVHWPCRHYLDWVEDEFMQLVRAYLWFNPHLSVRASWFGKEVINTSATNPAWEKWRPCQPTSPHWYNEARLQRYLAAHVSRGRESGKMRTVREFIAEFRGLSSTVIQSRILRELGCSHQSLLGFFGTQRVNSEGIAKLLAAMKRYSKPVAPKHLGIIGENHFRTRFAEAGAADETFKYQCRKYIGEDGIPYVTETCFALHERSLHGGAYSRLLVTGANWSAAIANPFRRFGKTGEGLEAKLHKVRTNASHPVILALHLAAARIQFADRGKSSIILNDDVEQPDG
jgi:DNA topoisomerase VI subunit B